MATPFGQFANGRMLFNRRTDRIPNFRDGARVKTEQVVLDIFCKLVFSAAQGTATAGATELKQQFLSGYICRWAKIDAGNDWLDLGTSWNWIDTGKKPDGLDSGTKIKTWIGDVKNLPARDGGEEGLTDLRSVILPYGIGGIGEVIRDVAGDRIDGVYTFNG